MFAKSRMALEHHKGRISFEHSSHAGQDAELEPFDIDLHESYAALNPQRRLHLVERLDTEPVSAGDRRGAFDKPGPPEVASSELLERQHGRNVAQPYVVERHVFEPVEGDVHLHQLCGGRICLERNHALESGRKEAGVVADVCPHIDRNRLQETPPLAIEEAVKEGDEQLVLKVGIADNFPADRVEWKTGKSRKMSGLDGAKSFAEKPFNYVASKTRSNRGSQQRGAKLQHFTGVAAGLSLH
jgi:hypothetical protein